MAISGIGAGAISGIGAGAISGIGAGAISGIGAGGGYINGLYCHVNDIRDVQSRRNRCHVGRRPKAEEFSAPERPESHRCVCGG